MSAVPLRDLLDATVLDDLTLQGHHGINFIPTEATFDLHCFHHIFLEHVEKVN